MAPISYRGGTQPGNNGGVGVADRRGPSGLMQTLRRVLATLARIGVHPEWADRPAALRA